MINKQFAFMEPFINKENMHVSTLKNVYHVPSFLNMSIVFLETFSLFIFVLLFSWYLYLVPSSIM